METLTILRSKTDDALEIFVRAQMELAAKMAEIEKNQAVYKSKVNLYDEMSRKPAHVLIAVQNDMTRLMFEIEDKNEIIRELKDEEEYLNNKCKDAGEALGTARKIEREFLDRLFKDQMTL